ALVVIGKIAGGHLERRVGDQELDIARRAVEESAQGLLGNEPEGERVEVLEHLLAAVLEAEDFLAEPVERHPLTASGQRRGPAEDGRTFEHGHARAANGRVQRGDQTCAPGTHHYKFAAHTHLPVCVSILAGLRSCQMDTYDVVVVGSGGAALIAAVHAAM